MANLMKRAVERGRERYLGILLLFQIWRCKILAECLQEAGPLCPPEASMQRQRQLLNFFERFEL